MKVLLVGGGGHVGRIVRPALEAVHQVSFLDLRPVPGAEDRTFVATLDNDDVVAKAVQGQDVVVYMALGTVGGDKSTCDQLNPAFDVNLRDQYRVIRAALMQGVRKFVTTSTLNVYGGLIHPYVMDEDNTPPRAFKSPYGMSKKLAEDVCVNAAYAYPDSVFVVLRLNLPLSDEEANNPKRYDDPFKARKDSYPTYPNDMRRLMLAAIACDVPGCHILQTSGDIEGKRYSNAKVTATLGWAPQGN